MTEKVLGLREQDFVEAIKFLKESECNDDGNFAVMKKEVFIIVREILEEMLKDKVPVVSLEAYEIMRKSERSWRFECLALKRRKVVSLEWIEKEVDEELDRIRKAGWNFPVEYSKIKGQAAIFGEGYDQAISDLEKRLFSEGGKRQ